MRWIYPWGDKADTKRPITEFGMIWFADIYWDWKGRTKEEYLEVVNG